MAAAQKATAQRSGSTAPPASPSVADVSPNMIDPTLNPFLQCVVRVESGGNYQAVSPNGLYMGAFQFSQPTWNYAAQASNWAILIGVPPNRASRPLKTPWSRLPSPRSTASGPGWGIAAPLSSQIQSTKLHRGPQDFNDDLREERKLAFIPRGGYPRRQA